MLYMLQLQNLYFPNGISATGCELLDATSYVSLFNGEKLEQPGFTWEKFCSGRPTPIRIYLVTVVRKFIINLYVKSLMTLQPFMVMRIN